MTSANHIPCTTLKAGRITLIVMLNALGIMPRKDNRLFRKVEEKNCESGGRNYNISSFFLTDWVFEDFERNFKKLSYQEGHCWLGRLENDRAIQILLINRETGFSASRTWGSLGKTFELTDLDLHSLKNFHVAPKSKLRGLAKGSREKILGRCKQSREKVCLINLRKKTRSTLERRRHLVAITTRPGIFKQLAKAVGSVNFQRVKPNSSRKVLHNECNCILFLFHRSADNGETSPGLQRRIEMFSRWDHSSCGEIQEGKTYSQTVWRNSKIGELGRKKTCL